MQRIATNNQHETGQWVYVPDYEKPAGQIEYLTALLHQITKNRKVLIAKLTGRKLKDIEASLEDFSREINILKNDMQFLAASIIEEKILQYTAARDIVKKTDAAIRNIKSRI